MIFIGGIAEGIKQLIYGRQVFCRFCGRGTEVELYMLYTYFSFFFIPLFKGHGYPEGGGDGDPSGGPDGASKRGLERVPGYRGPLPAAG